MNRQRLLGFCASRIEGAEKTMKTFQTSFEREPESALSWSGSVFLAVADREVTLQLKEFVMGVSGDVDLDEFLKERAEEIINALAGGETSSPMQNYYRNAQTRAKARLLKALRGAGYL